MAMNEREKRYRKAQAKAAKRKEIWDALVGISLILLFFVVVIGVVAAIWTGSATVLKITVSALVLLVAEVIAIRMSS